jgi:hypothetical protein
MEGVSVPTKYEMFVFVPDGVLFDASAAGLHRRETVL